MPAEEDPPDGRPSPGGSLPCCDYRDHSSGECQCPEHFRSTLHPFGYECCIYCTHNAVTRCYCDPCCFIRSCWTDDQLRAVGHVVPSHAAPR